MNKTLLLGDFLFFGLPGIIVVIVIAVIILKILKKKVWHLACVGLLLFVVYINVMYNIGEMVK